MRKPDEIAHSFQSTDSLEHIQDYFLVGIGGAGMSALARMLAHRGYRVAGSDANDSAELQKLVAERIPCEVGHTGNGITDRHALVVSDAIEMPSSPEVARALELGVPIVRRSQALSWLLRPYKVIAVTGTHGKTTTTAMIGVGLIAAGFDPLVVVGAQVPQWNGPVREGKGAYAVVEACEAYDSFHDLEPFSVVLTNLELDHVDFHQTYERLRNSVVRFVDTLSPDGWLIYCTEDRGACEIAELASTRALPYGVSEDWQRQLTNIGGTPPASLLHFSEGGALALPGRHNLLNATGALATAASVGADLERVAAALRQFGGAERRLQIIQSEPIHVVDDYAHHPTEIAASLGALRERYFQLPSGSKLIAVFQPHLYSRTSGQYAEFAQALDLADSIFITDIYPARETPLPGVSSALIAELCAKPVHYVPSRHLLPREVARIARPGDVVVAMGAGTIGEFAKEFVRESNRRLDRLSGRRPIKVAVLYGGDSAEREVSLHSGAAAAAALRAGGFEVALMDVSDLLLRGKALSDLSGTDRPDVAFLALHGTHGEDGAIQGLLELLHVPYTGSDVLASSLCMNKSVAKAHLELAGLTTPKSVLLAHAGQPVPLHAPLIVKPNAQGSTVGLSFVETDDELPRAIERAFAYDSAVLVEEWIRGVEISTPVLAGRALAPVEIVPASGRYDFAGKYRPGATQEIVPARIGDRLLAEAKTQAELAHRTMGCRGASRTDAIVSGETIYTLEINTLPGLTPTSLLPNSAAYEGMDFNRLCREIVMDALAIDGAKEKEN